MATTKSTRKPKAARAKTKGSVPVGAFPVVAAGASAGGLAAFTSLLKDLPATPGMAFVLIQHLEPKHESALSALLAKATPMPVSEVTEGLGIEPDHVYVIPPNKQMTLSEGTLHLTPRADTGSTPRPIDEFCRSLAEEKGSLAIGIVLSGTGSDGTQGMKAIKAAGGITFAQDPKTAQWPAMSMSAIAAGAVDFILTPKRIAAELARFGRHPYLVDTPAVAEGTGLDKICLLLRAAIGVDFRLYKPATVRRRIARRMALQKISSLDKYAQVLRKDEAEAQALADDIFIHVTSFFRDPACFGALRKRVLAKLSARKPGAEAIRIWVAGCSTGEEVYSIAMLVMEELGEKAARIKVQIFGTDIQESALEQARSAIYSEAAVAGVSRERLKRFFVQADHGFQIIKPLRDLCVFARHDLAKDPPFSKLDLISCRNVLIYMGPALQKRILSIFQYALKPGGALFLGSSESISEYSDVFTPEDRKNRIFARRPVAAGHFQSFEPAAELSRAQPAQPSHPTRPPVIAADLRSVAESALLEYYSPPALIVDSELHIVHFQGDMSPFLAPATGQPSFYLLKMVRSEFLVDLRAALYKARKNRAPVTVEAVRYEEAGKAAAVHLEVLPLDKHGGSAHKGHLMVVFEKLPAELPESLARGGAGRRAGPEKTARLERDLAATREQLRALIAEHETSQEEMKAANEEILSSNEELQSTNEELETAKEELQSSNEELQTLNEELQHRNAELGVLTHDLNNLLVGIDIPVLVLDSTLRVRRFTPMAGAVLNLIPGDIGRPFSNIASNLETPNWAGLFAEVMQQGHAIEREVTDRGGRRYSLRMRPYKTSETEIKGVLVVLLDTDILHRATEDARRASEYARAIVDTVHEALCVVDDELCITTVNRSFCQVFCVQAESVVGKPFLGAVGGLGDAPRLRKRLNEVLSAGVQVDDFALTLPSETQVRHLRLHARQIDKSRTILIAIQDLTAQIGVREELEKSETTIRALLDSSTQSVVAVDTSGKIVLASGVTAKMFGYDHRELLGQPVEILVPEADQGRHAGFHASYFKDPQSRPMGQGLHLEGRRKDGTLFPMEVALSAIDSPTGKIAVAFVTDITRRTALERASETNRRQVRALAARLMTAQEEERGRVSRELHDQICQQLASLAIDIGELADDPPARAGATARLKQLQARVVKASEEARLIAYQLHPSVLEDLGLVASLRALCNETEKRGGLAVDFTGGPLPVPIPRPVASCVYRIAQEGLQNIIKHSQAKRAHLRLDATGDSVNLVLEDDGAGFNLEEVRGRGGLGLVGMEERTRLVNGVLTVTGRPGRGTRIALEVPLEERTHEAGADSAG